MGRKVKEYAVILIIVGFLAYVPSLFGNFVWDDEDFVYANTYVKEAKIEKFFTENAIAGRGKASNYYRPIQFSLYALLYRIAGASPWIYHLTGVLLHITAGVLIYFTFVHLLYPFPAFVASLLFLIHPVQTESVSYISGLSDALYTCFFFSSLLVFFRRKKTGWSAETAVSLMLFVLAILSKELGIILPGILLIYLLISRKLDRKDIPVLALYFIIAAAYLAMRFTVLRFMDISLAWTGTPYGAHILTRFATFFQNFFTFLALLIFPSSLYMERDFTTPVITNIFSVWTGLFLLFNAAVVLFLSAKRAMPQYRTALLLYILFVCSLVPFTGIFLLNGIFYEHYLYLPMAFFWGAVVSFLGPVLKQKPALVIVTVVMVLLIFRSYARQWEWIDNERFYRQTLERAPKSIRIINGLAMTLAENNKCTEALVYYQKALVIDPSVPNIYHNMANCYAELGLIDKAEIAYLKALKVNPNFQFSYVSLLQLYLQTDQKEKAKTLLRDRIIPRYPDSREARDLYNRL